VRRFTPAVTSANAVSTQQNTVEQALVLFVNITNMTKQLAFTPEIQATLNDERYHHPVPLVQRRREVLWLKSHGLAHQQLAKLAGVSENTVREYLRLYEEGGLAKLQEVKFFRPESKLQVHLTPLEAYFQAHPPATIKEAQSQIATLTGIQRSETQVLEFLKKTRVANSA
jgi:transposase